MASPITLQLSLTETAFDDEVDRRAAMSALLHERHHWLQTIGTSAGIFHYLLMDQQAVVIQDLFAHEKQLAPSDLPLVSGRFSKSTAVFLWEQLEYIRRLLWGARCSDIDILQRDRGPLDLAFTSLTQLLQDLLSTAVPDAARARSYFDKVWSISGARIEHRPWLPSSNGWSLGARHLMEDAARSTEMFRYAHYELDSVAPGSAIAVRPDTYFTGMYGKARKLFYMIVDETASMRGRISPASEVVFSFVCDAALNRIYPPAGPANGGFIDTVWNPATYMIYITEGLSGFDLNRPLDIYDPAAVRQLISELEVHLDGKLNGLLKSAKLLRQGAADEILNELAHSAVAEQLFDLNDGGWPVAKNWHGRLTYMLALSKAAINLRNSTPELFVFPVCHYATSREKFRELYTPIASPLVLYGKQGIAPSPGRSKGWLEFFLCDAIMYDLLRGMVTQSADELVARIAPYAHICFGVERGRSLVEASLRLFFGSRPAGKYIIDGVRALWRTAET